MKNAIKAFAILLGLAFTYNANATPAPTMGDIKDASGSFKCKIIQPISITQSAENCDLGELVVDEDKDYATNNNIDWNITGQGGTTVGHAYYYKISQVTSNAVAATATDAAVPASITLTMGWALADGSTVTTPVVGATTPSLLKADGSSKITATVTHVETTSSAPLGDATFTQKVEVSYASF